MATLIKKPNIFLVNRCTESGDGTDEEDLGEGEYHNVKVSKKREKKRQEREAIRQVHCNCVILFIYLQLYIIF